MSEQQLSAAGKAPRPGLLWHQRMLVLVEMHMSSSLGALKVVFYLIGAGPERGDPSPLSPSLLWLPGNSLAAGWAVRVLSLEMFVFLLFKLVKWSHSLSDSVTSRSSVTLGHGNAWLGLRRRRRLCWVSLCSLPVRHKWNHIWLFRTVPRTTTVPRTHCLSCLCKPCYRWRPLQTGAVGLFEEINVNKSPCGCRSSPYSVLNTLHRTSGEA